MYENKRYILAGALLAGHHNRRRLIISELFEANRERLKTILVRTLDLIEDAFEARGTLVVNGALVDAGPDHYARLEAGELVLRLLRRAR